MRLKKLEMYGFKSFADRIEVQFDEGITGIVGPNGSGKSNIGDAMRWVLGEQNARALRGGRMEDIIFSGAANRKSLSWCEVALTLDNSEGTLPVDYAEVSIVRRVFRNGDSEYFINKKSCRLKDIIELFRDTGIGRDGYSIIGQGQIAQIIDNRPEERRSVFHESAGIMKYRVRKEEAERRLANTRENLQRLGDIMSEMESRLEPLRIQSENAKRYLALSGELKDLEINQFLCAYEQGQEKIAQCKAQAADCADACAQATAQLEQAEQRGMTLSAQLDELEQQMEERRSAISQADAREQRRQGEEQLIAERIRNIDSDILRLEGERTQALARAEQTAGEADTLAKSLLSARDSLKAGTDQLSAWEERRRAMEEELNAEEEKAEAFKTEALDKMNRLGDIRNVVTRLATMAEAVQQRMTQVREGITALTQEQEHTRAAAEEVRTQVDKLEGQHTQLMAASNEKAQHINDLRTQRAAAMEKTGKLREGLQAAQTRERMLQAMKRDYEGFAEAVRRLLKDNAAGHTQGWVQGVVAEAIQVPKELVRAVEMALGPAMQNIITNDEQDAKKLIDYLREKKYGRATFLPISGMQPRSLNSQERAALCHPGFIGVAAELVSAEARYANIISNLLGRTVIAQDMQAAIDMARSCRHSLRFVTLQGDIINPGGSMTGGSAQSRYTSLLGREAEIKEVSRRCETLQQESQDAQRQAAALDARVDAEKEELSALETQIHESALACAREKERLLKAEQNGQRLADSLTQSDDTLTQLEENLRDILRQQTQAQSRQGAEEQNQQSVREDIVRVQQQVNRKREEYQQFLQRISDLKVALAADESRRENLERQIARMRADAARLTQEAGQKADAADVSQQRLAQEKQALTQNTSAAGDYAAAGRKAREELSKLEEQRMQLRAARDQNARGVNELRAAADELRTRAGKLDLQMVRLESDFENMHNRIWDHYELTYANALPLRREDYDDAQAAPRIAEIRAEVRKMGTVNVGAVEEYEQLGGRYEENRRQAADLEKAQDDLLAIIQELAVKMEERFREQFAKINENFSATFAELFGGGTAQLVLQDEDDILNSGVEIKAQPPGTQLKLLSLLSGGEKALTAIALLFAMLKVNPSPFCVLDEIEAALDDANVRRFAQYLRNFTKTTQFVVVTHRKGTMEACNALYGVTMEDQGISRMISVKLEDIKEETPQ